jgi:predicted ATP-dependent protease
MSDGFEVPYDKLTWRCDLSYLPFTCTAEMTPLEDFIGQERAIRAIEFGLGVNKPGFNIFVTGLTGTGKTSIIRSFLKKITSTNLADPEEPADWCYVYNFAEPDRPRAIKLRRGWGKLFKTDMEQLVHSLQRDAKKMFESDDYSRERQQMLEQLQKQQQAMMQALVREAGESGFILRMTPAGIGLLPAKSGKPLEEAEYLALGPDEKQQLEERRGAIEKKVEATLREGKKLEREVGARLEAIEMRAADYLVRIPLAELKEKYREYPKVVDHLDAVRGHILRNLERFKAGEAAPLITPVGPLALGDPSGDAFLPYRVNIFVDNSEAQGPPIIVETNPTYHNLIGVVEKKPIAGGYFTDFTLIKAGSISRANGGYLVLYDRDVFANAGVWEALQRVIKNRELRIEEPGIFFGFVPPQGLRPEPIPTDTKIIMIGDPYLYRTLASVDPDFRETFKVKADFNFEVDRNQENITAFACFIADYCSREGLRHFDTDAVARVIEQCARKVEDQNKLSTRFSDTVDLLVESDYWAAKEQAQLVAGRHVERAVIEKNFRLNLIEKYLQELIAEGTVLVDVTGAVVGQVNGLAIYQMGDFSFGKPSRITAKTFMGRGGIVNIERESKLSGNMHDKGVLILAGYLGGKYAQQSPLSLSSTVCFEQSYDGVDGDSASSAELYAILSSLAEIPIRQGIAVTGSVNQNGEVQAIGGVNQKIEGHYDICRLKGLTGEQGVMIPRANLRNLMLRSDVVDAVKGGRFRVYAVGTIDEGIEVLTGVTAGVRDSSGKYAAGSINDRVEQKLRQFTEVQKSLAPGRADVPTAVAHRA